MRNLVDAWFKRLVVINLVLVFIVVIAGSIVRVTESGMGCPDWPKCFGAYIPPTSEDQVTWHEGEDFFEGQMIIHEEKLYNAKKDLTASTSFNPAEWEEFTKHGYATYNPVHTWIEFINRLATVALGFPVMALFALSFFYWKDRRARVYLSFAVVFLVGFQAWLGKLVVDSNLKGQTITLHMIGVFAIIGVLLILLAKARRTKEEIAFPDKLFKRLSSVALYITVLMVVLGTQVREQIDMIAKTTTDRMLWIDQVDWMFITHRSLVYVVIAVNGYLLYQAIKNNWYKTRWIMIAAIIIAEALVGIILAHYGFPKAAQPLHLLLSTILFALQFDLLIQLRAP
ncbi:MAG: COX15/CtaA family protein, partial [Flavobacteriales bacterium]